MKKIILRADGSSQIGMGHVMRCLALAQMLQNDFELSFALFGADDKVRALIKEYNLPVIELPVQTDLSYADSSDAVIVDGYWFDPAYIKSLKEKNKKVIQVDDLVASEFFSDIIINHAIGVNYSGSVFHGKHSLLAGNKYALLRKEFLTLKKLPKYFPGIKAVTISLGGADPYNYTVKILAAIIGAQALQQTHINVLIGTSYSHKNELLQLIDNNPKRTIEIRESLDAKGIISLLEATSLYICSASTVVYEAIAVGVPVACFLTADNQENIYNGLVLSNTVAPMGDIQTQTGDQLEKSLRAIILNYSEVSKLVKYQDQFIDGQSGERIKKEIMALWN